MSFCYDIKKMYYYHLQKKRSLVILYISDSDIMKRLYNYNFTPSLRLLTITSCKQYNHNFVVVLKYLWSIYMYNKYNVTVLSNKKYVPSMYLLFIFLLYHPTNHQTLYILYTKSCTIRYIHSYNIQYNVRSIT